MRWPITLGGKDDEVVRYEGPAEVSILATIIARTFASQPYFAD